MVTQREALDEYIQNRSDIEIIRTSIQNLEKVIELKMEETKRDVAENKKFIIEHRQHCDTIMASHEKRVMLLEQFSNKVIYLHTAVIFLVGFIAGVWGKGLFS